MQMVRTSYLYFAPGTVLVGVLGGYNRNDAPVLLRERDCYRFGPVV